jgi:adenylate kinase
MNAVFLGPPGAGKGTQAFLIALRFGLKHISTGELLRQAAAKGTELGREAKTRMDEGRLVPDGIMIGLIRQVLPSGGGFILDGFPRTVEQARELDEMLAGENLTLDHVLYIDVDDETATQRLSARKRSDDGPDTIQRRLLVYHAATEPVVNFYREGGRLKRIDGSPGAEAVTDSIVKELGVTK